MSQTYEELESLWLDWESGSLDDQGQARLLKMLREDRGAQSHFVQLQLLSAALHLEADAGLEAPATASSSAKGTSLESTQRRVLIPRRLQTYGPSFWLSLATLIVIGLVVSWLMNWSSGQAIGPGARSGVRATAGRRESSNEATSRGVALITRLVDVIWEEDQQALETGDALPLGRFAISAGLAQIEFFCGATVVIEGPAELNLQSADRAKVLAGRLRAQVPPAARGFSLEIEDLEIVDLGTEFGVSVSSEGTNVQVFDGEVELHPAGNEKKLLTTGQAVVQTPAGQLRETPSTPSSFVDIAALESQDRLQRAARFEHWRSWSSKLRSDTRLLAFYTFDQEGDWQRRLHSSTEPSNPELDGAIVGARQVTGRWPAKQALEFKLPADRVRVQIPGEFDSLSLACWVKIDSLDRWYNSLFLTDGYDKGEPHWQILDDGRLYFSVRPTERGEAGPTDYKALSPPFWNPSLNGKWIHLAVTCDLESNTISHYLNGTLLSRHLVPAEQMPTITRIGTASLGNWALPTLPDAKFAIRNLNGSIDEFAIFADALTAAEVKELYEYGKP